MTNPAIQHAIIPHKNIKDNHQTKTLKQSVSQAPKQQSKLSPLFLLHQQIQFKIHIIILIKANATNIRYTAYRSKYSPPVREFPLLTLSTKTD